MLLCFVVDTARATLAIVACACVLPQLLSPTLLILSGVPVSFHVWKHSVWPVSNQPSVTGRLWPGCPWWVLTAGSVLSVAFTAETVVEPFCLPGAGAGGRNDWHFWYRQNSYRNAKEKGAKFPVFTAHPVGVLDQNALWFHPEQQTICLALCRKVNRELQNASVYNGASQIYYFNNKAASKNSLYINILPSYRFQKFPFYFMSFISFCFLASWLHCVLGCEFRGQGLCLAQFHLLFTVFLYHNLNEPKDGVSCLFFFSLNHIWGCQQLL